MKKVAVVTSTRAEYTSFKDYLYALGFFVDGAVFILIYFIYR